MYLFRKNNEGEVIDCPNCGETAIVNDNGIHCSNSNCKNGS